MAVIDSGMERHPPFIGWFASHGAATALMGCVAFWIAFAAALYLVF